jgi:hypothetical protein
VRREDFSIWIRRNPLKRPDSTKEIQGNPSYFFSDLFGFAWIFFPQPDRLGASESRDHWSD